MDSKKLIQAALEAREQHFLRRSARENGSLKRLPLWADIMEHQLIMHIHVGYADR